MKISACWIVKDEVEELARSINSVKDAVDELVVVATTESNEIEKVVQQAGAKLYHFAWIQDFAAARNFALEKITGDYVLFLDADEWFEPAFTMEKRKEMEQLIAQEPNLDMMVVPMTNIDANTGLLMNAVTVPRILRADGSLEYVGRIHELAGRKDKQRMKVKKIDANLNHTGYARDKNHHKMARNIEMLEKDLAEGKLSPLLVARTRAYLVREYGAAGNNAKQFEMVQELLHDANTSRFLPEIKLLSTSYVFLALRMAENPNYREKFSRLQVYNEVVKKFKKNNSNNVAMQFTDLFYKLCLEKIDEPFLEEVAQKEAEKAWDNLDEKDSITWSQLADVYIAAGLIHWRRGNRVKALEYTSLAFIKSQDFINDSGLEILLLCIKGLPETDQILYLSQIFGTSNAAKLRWLTGKLCFKGYENLFLYFFKKQLDQGSATWTDSILVQLSQKNEEEAYRLLQEYEENGVETKSVEYFYFLLYICSGDDAFFEKHNAKMGVHKKIAQAYLKNEVLETVALEEEQNFHANFQTIASFAPQNVERYRNIFKNSVLAQYSTASFFLRDENYEGVLAMEMPYNNEILLSATIMAYNELGMFEESFATCKKAVEDGNANTLILSLFSALCVRANRDLQNKALDFYKMAVYQYNEYVDLNDFINIGYWPHEMNRKQAKMLQKITATQLEKELQDDKNSLAISLYETTLEQAVDIFIADENVVEAEKYMRRLLVCSAQKEIWYQKIGNLYEKIGNKQLAGYCIGKAKEK